ncbi:DNA-directed RNA polymerase subunit beta [Gemella sp. GH3]|uniref:DNA-directed RNA polymerase subunit beta n=1 Tax=unclassified Gemella TaxID=2624949 RepID=UPI0015D0661E|nr:MULTISPECIES: DNA-directed RNA polymerase subunit beta [unclassified Gemella]MBF0714059.1 DNA-directed RNA polymerase subunit beta [Gemella sp. GH3.1]NYS51011.1 DNA-directed RNA polymerase subunit beta [Gemella sp. GH3]
MAKSKKKSIKQVKFYNFIKFFIILFVTLYIGFIIGYTLIGNGEFLDALSLKPLKHIIDIITN